MTDTTTKSFAAASLLSLPIWRRYGGWMSADKKVHVREPKDRPVDCIVILAHAMTMNGASMMMKSRQMVRDLLPGAVIISPDGIYGADPDQHLRARRVRSRDKSFCWFELPQGRLSPITELGKSIRPSVDYLHSIIDTALKKYDMDESKLYLVGYSQGGAIAVEAAIEREKTCAGVANICGPFFDSRCVGVQRAISKPPIFYGIDLGDEVTPAGLAYHAMTAMKRLKLPVTAHITPANESVDVTIYDTQGRPYIVSKAQPGAPTFLEHKKYYRDEQGRLRYNTELERTGHWLNDGMRDALIHTFKTLKPTGQVSHYETTPQPYKGDRYEKAWDESIASLGHTNLGCSPLDQIVTPRITMERLAIWWALNPMVLSSQLPVRTRPLTTWNKIAHLSKRRVGHVFSGMARGIAKLLTPILYDLPEQMAELGSKNKVFVKTKDLDQLMGQPKKRSIFNLK